MSPSWSRGDLDLSLFSGICPSVSRLRGQGRAGQGGARCGCERPKRGSRQFRVRFVFVSPELDPEWELGPRGGREWTFGSQKPCVAVSPWAGGSEALGGLAGLVSGAQSTEYGRRSRSGGFPARGLVLGHSAARSRGHRRMVRVLGSDSCEGKRVGCEPKASSRQD